MGIINNMPSKSGGVESGDVVLFNTSGDREGYLLCNGSAVLASSYPQFKDKLIEGIQYQEGTVTSSLDRYVITALGYASNDEWLIIGGETASSSYTSEGAFVFNKSTGECKLFNRLAGLSYTQSTDILFPFYVGGKFYIGSMSGSYYEYDPVTNTGTQKTGTGYPGYITTSYYGFSFGSGRIDGSDYAYVQYYTGGKFEFYHTLDGLTWYSGTALETSTTSMGKIVFDSKNEKMFYTKSGKIYSYSVVGPTITEIAEITGTLIGCYDGMLVVLDATATQLIKVYDAITYEEICSFYQPRETDSSSGVPENALVGGYVISATAWNGDYVYLVPIYKARQYKGISNIKNYATITTDMTDYNGLLNLPNDLNYIIWRDSCSSSSYANTGFNILDSSLLLDTYVLPNINPSDGPYYGYIKT